MVLTFSLCTSCGEHMQPEEARCASCGNARLNADPVSTLSFSPPSAPTQAKREYRSELRSERKSERPTNLLSMVLPRKGQPNVVLPIAATMVGLFALIPICMYSIESSYQNTAHSYLNEKALEAIKTGQNTDAIEIMTREQIEHRGLGPDQQQIMDQARYERAGQALHSGSYDLAVIDLKHISARFPRNMVEQRLAQVNYQIAHQPKQPKQAAQRKAEEHPSSPAPPPVPPPAQPQKKSMSGSGKLQQLAAKDLSKGQKHNSEMQALEGVAVVPQQNNAPVSPPVVQPPVRVGWPYIVPQNDRALSRAQPSQGQISQAANEQGEQLRPSGQRDRRAGQSAGALAMVVKPSPSPLGNDTSGRSVTHAGNEAINESEFVPLDLVRYNELLATYFSREQKTTHEPPSFKEWIKLGKPKF
jgi:hypothetical protein